MSICFHCVSLCDTVSICFQCVSVCDTVSICFQCVSVTDTACVFQRRMNANLVLISSQVRCSSSNPCNKKKNYLFYSAIPTASLFMVQYGIIIIKKLG